MYLVAILGLGIRQGWTMSHMVKSRAAIWSFLKLTALYFIMSEIVHCSSSECEFSWLNLDFYGHKIDKPL